jgi:hypothetical protein
LCCLLGNCDAELQRQVSRRFAGTHAGQQVLRLPQRNILAAAALAGFNVLAQFAHLFARDRTIEVRRK